MRKFSDMGIKTRILELQLLGRDFSYGGKPLLFFATLYYNTWNIFSKFANMC